MLEFWYGVGCVESASGMNPISTNGSAPAPVMASMIPSVSVQL